MSKAGYRVQYRILVHGVFGPTARKAIIRKTWKGVARLLAPHYQQQPAAHEFPLYIANVGGHVTVEREELACD